MPQLLHMPRPAYPALAVWLAFAVASVVPSLAQAQPPGPQIDAGLFEQQLVPFFDRHCFRCHNADTKKGGLVLEGREPQFDGPGAAVWTRVFERLEAGEMPPKRRPRPPEEDIGVVTKWLQQNLHAADLAQRCSIRRLNRFEYENTIRDLLGIDVQLSGMLPEDGVAHGFDNVGSALSISTELMSAYLAAADHALDVAIADGPEPATIHEEHTLRENARTRAGQILFDKGDAVVVYNSGGYVPTDFAFSAPLEGDYRLRIGAYAWQSDEPLVMVVRSINYGRDIRRVLGFFEVGDQSDTHELVRRLIPGDQIKITPFRLGTRRIDHPPLYPGPGIAIQGLEVEGPLREWPPPSRRRLFGDLDLEAATIADARGILTGFLPRAFRRVVGAEDVAPYVALVEQGLGEGRNFGESVRIALKAALCSPDFLFVGDVDQEPGQPLGDAALATQLSYFLWSSMPDEELFAEAKAGRLRDPLVLAQQVERMLGDPKASEFTENFTGQWLDLRLIDFTTPDKSLFPEYDELLHVSMVEESQRFFREILDHDLSLLNFIDSGFSMLNGRLAEHYGIDGVEGLEFRRVSLPAESRRGGVLTQASVLKVTANGTNTSPVLRGAWVLDNILGQPSPPPPAGIEVPEPDTRGATTIRQQLEAHRSEETCSSCHAHIDPPGFALESFDVIGGWRDRYRSMMGTGEAADVTVEFRRVQYKLGLPVDATGAMADGAAFRDIEGFRRLLLRDRDQFARALTKKLFVYAMGRDPGFGDRSVIDRILARVRAENYGFRTLIHEITRTF